MPLLIITWFIKCSVPDFVGPFELMINTERVIQLYNGVDRHDNRKFLERMKNLTLLVSNFFRFLNISNCWNITSNHWHVMSKVKDQCDNCFEEQYSLYCPHHRDKSKIRKAEEERAACRGGDGRNGGRGSGLAVDTVAKYKVTKRSGATISGMGIEMIMEIVFKRGSIIGFAIAAVSSVDGMTAIILDFMPLGSVILALLPCLMTMIIGNFHGRLLVSQLALEPLRRSEWSLKTNIVWLFLK